MYTRMRQLSVTSALTVFHACVCPTISKFMMFSVALLKFGCTNKRTVPMPFYSLHDTKQARPTITLPIYSEYFLRQMYGRIQIVANCQRSDGNGSLRDV